MTLIAPTLQAFFTDRLARQRQASPRTIAAYRDTMRLLLKFVQQHGGKSPSALDWDDLTADVISAFLNHLEDERGNSARTRNVRLTAIRSLFSFAALQHPEHALLIARVLDIPPKRFDKRIVTFLTAEEGDALLAAPDPGRWEGRRDKAMMALAVQTGLRVSELTGLNCADITLGDGAAVRCEGKGRKQRAVPLDRPVQQLLRAWLEERSGGPHDPLFCTRTGRRLSRDAVAQRLSTHVKAAAQACPSLLGKSVHPHVLRHSCAMSLQGRGVASDATFCHWREGGGARVPALPGSVAGAARRPDTPLFQGFPVPRCIGWQDAASRSVAFGDWLMRCVCAGGAGWGRDGERWRSSVRTGRCRRRRVRRCWRRCWPGGGTSSWRAG
jgi:site-specific recombinase XerD